MSDTTVKKIEAELAAFDQDETTQVEETTEVEYVAPFLCIVRTQSIGDHTDSIRIELQESEVMASPGAVISFAESTLRALREESPAAGSHNIEMHFSPLSPEMQAALQQRLEQMVRPAEAGVEDLSDAAQADAQAAADDTCAGGC